MTASNRRIHRDYFSSDNGNRTMLKSYTNPRLRMDDDDDFSQRVNLNIIDLVPFVSFAFDQSE